MGTCKIGKEPVSAVLGRRSDGLSITTLNVPGSVLREVCSSAVEKDRDRMWAIGFDGVCVCRC